MIFRSADGAAYAVAAAAAITASNVFSLPVVFAIAVAAGGIASFAARQLGAVGTAIAAATAFAYAFAFAYVGGESAIILLTVALLGGLVLASLAARGKSARIPLFVLAPVLSVLVP